MLNCAFPFVSDRGSARERAEGVFAVELVKITFSKAEQRQQIRLSRPQPLRRGLDGGAQGKFSPPEVLKPIRCQLGVAHRVLDVLVPEPGLQRPGIVAGVG